MERPITILRENEGKIPGLKICLESRPYEPEAFSLSNGRLLAFPQWHLQSGEEYMGRPDTNVLVVDDEIGTRESLRMILKPNYRVHCVGNGYEAIRMVREAKMDVILLDLRMPGISGIDTLKVIKEIDPDARVIIITAYGTQEYSADATRHGVFDFVLKPFNVPEILSRIERASQSRPN